MLNFIGTPIMLLPAVMANRLLPDFAAQQKPQDVYVHLILGLLPAGMTGIIVAALFSATMATVSADLNAIASVLTKDLYQRIVRPHASERSLVTAGRAITLLLGSALVGISIWLGYTSRGSLFQIMVTAFGVFLASMLLPSLATLLFRKLSSKGVLTGFVCGLLSGVATLAAKTMYLQHSGTVETQAMDYELEAITIFVNITMTCLGILLGSWLLPAWAEEEQRTAAFFVKLATPVSMAERTESVAHGNSSAKIIRLSTLALGVLVVISGMLSTSVAGRWIDAGIGALLMLFVAPFRSASRHLVKTP